MNLDQDGLRQGTAEDGLTDAQKARRSRSSNMTPSEENV